jgi:amino acid adenylation domain-containing protein
MNRPKTLCEAFFNSVREDSESTALVVDGRAYSYGALARRALAVSEQIASLPRDRNKIVAVLCERDVGAYASLLGILASGDAYCPLHLGWPRERLIEILTCVRPSALVVEAAHEELARDLVERLSSIEILVIDSTRESKRSLPADAHLPAPDDRAYVLFTSGSTGKPKGIAIKHRQAAVYLANAARILKLKRGDRVSQVFELTFDLSVHDMFVTWNAGACLYTVKSADAFLPATFIQTHELDVWFSTPSTISRSLMMRALGANALPSLRESLFCGESLTCESAEAWRQAAPCSRLHNFYGPTEATIAVSAASFEAGEVLSRATNGLLTIGKLFPDHHGLIEGEELCLRGEQVISSYFTAGEEARFISRGGHVWYRTGDRVSEDAGEFSFLGRVDDQVKVRGFRVELGEVEAVLREACGGRRVCALASPEAPQPCEKIHAFVEGEDTSDEQKREWFAHCRRKLPEYMVPWEISCVPAFPLNSSGKLDKTTLMSLAVSARPDLKNRPKS